MSHLPFLAATAAAVSACAQAPAPSAAPAVQPAAPASSAPARPSAACNAAPAQGAVGQYISDAVQDGARTASGASIVRVLRFGQQITKEFNMQRINLEVDSSGRVLRVFCG